MESDPTKGAYNSPAKAGPMAAQTGKGWPLSASEHRRYAPVERPDLPDPRVRRGVIHPAEAPR
jgi:hypothetical protein